jgi:mannose-6-phosphate isomerase-like protein (cupin superfamily)
VISETVTRAAIDFDAQERFVSLRRQLGVTGFGINQVTLQSGQRMRIHRHAKQEEVYLVLRGKLALVIEGEEELESAEGELARVPASVRRQLVNRFGDPCTIVAIGASGSHESRDAEAFNDWNDSEGRPPQEVPFPLIYPSRPKDRYGKATRTTSPSGCHVRLLGEQHRGRRRCIARSACSVVR